MMKRLLIIWIAVAIVLNADAQAECLNSQDANQDGLIGVEDLMDLLSHWGDTDLDFDGVYDSVDLCTDEEACNYYANPTQECLYLDVVGICGGGCPEDADEDGICDWTCNYGLLYQGHVYPTIEINGQCWFAENLQSQHYANGDLIPGDLSNGEWSTTNEGAQAIYDNELSSLAEYGRLYNWYAVDDERGLCPTGWHVPTDGEFMTLEMGLGMSEIQTNLIGYRGTDQGAQMKSSPSDDPSWNGTNTSSFTGLPGGLRATLGYFELAGNYGLWWSSSQYGSSYAWYRLLDGSSQQVSRNYYYQGDGFSVRCLKDSE